MFIFVFWTTFVSENSLNLGHEGHFLKVRADFLNSAAHGIPSISQSHFLICHLHILLQPPAFITISESFHLSHHYNTGVEGQFPQKWGQSIPF